MVLGFFLIFIFVLFLVGSLSTSKLLSLPIFRFLPANLYLGAWMGNFVYFRGYLIFIWVSLASKINIHDQIQNLENEIFWILRKNKIKRMEMRNKGGLCAVSCSFFKLCYYNFLGSNLTRTFLRTCTWSGCVLSRF